MLKSVRKFRDLALNRGIILFFLPLAAIILILSPFDYILNQWAFYIFSIITWIWAIFLFRVFVDAEIDGKSVDIWYYSLAMAAASIAFFNNYTERRIIFEKDECNSILSKKERIQFNIDFLKSLNYSSKTVSDSIFKKYLDIKYLTAIDENSCSNNSKTTQYLIDMDTYFLSRYKSDYKDNSETTKSHQWCKILKLSVSPKDIKYSSNPIILLNEIDSSGFDRYIYLKSRHGLYFLEDLYGPFKLAQPADNEQSIKKKILNLENEIKICSNKALNYNENIRNEINRETSVDDASGYISKVNFLIWPYLLIMALGLKLAKNSYFEND